MEVNSSSNSQIEVRSGKAGDIGDANLADAVLAADVVGDETRTSNKYTSKPVQIFDRMAVISKYQTKEGIPIDQQNILNKSRASETQKTYNRYWRQWVEWCRKQDPLVEPLKCREQDILPFLVSMNQHRRSTLKWISIRAVKCIPGYLPKQSIAHRPKTMKAVL
ncbi:hypothetical protein EC973_002759 [Apophysomyces ossiformis]|uniref:Uncharacterized protein n=1 Tax=Apophysomyces ossiformis TaxID=679940 RepID=A0A8H7EV17_9FUNG|nr:hypothetical protein EC973_002759 [Apophysomyces ossiformis]